MSIDPQAVLATLTLEQKVSLLAGHDHWHTAHVPGVPVLRCTDGPAGARGTSWSGPRSTSFPCGTALGATFDTALVEEVGRALGREARSKGAQVLLAPTVNLHRTPIGGRNFECMSEDPELTASIAVAYVKGLQSERVAACIKHFIANDTEFERTTISSDVDERTLRELYLVPFEAAIRSVDDGGAGVRVVMSSYNRVNGTYASENTPLLRGVLRDEWGFDGVVFSDWFGTHSAAASLEASLDLEMPGPTLKRGDRMLEAVRDGAVSVERVDESVLRLLQLFEWCGLRAGGSAADFLVGETTEDSAETRDVIRRAAIAATVLLKNDRGLLPIGATTTVALIGPNSERGQIQGGGSAQVRANRPIGPLLALRDRGLDLRHEEGCTIGKRLPAVRGAFEVTYRGADNLVAHAASNQLQFLWMDAPATGIARRAFGATISGTFTPDVTGDWAFGLTAVGAAVLRVNGEVVCDLSTPQRGGAYFGEGSPEIRGVAALDAGVVCAIEIDYPYMEYDQMRGLMVGAAPAAIGDTIERAELLAAVSDVAIVIVGTDAEWETEGEDRVDMHLPGRQDELIARVVAANPNTIVVINAGSPVSMPWLDAVPTVMQVWFPGAEFGPALADILLGVAEPGGRLPVTIPKRLVDTPAFLSHPGEGGSAPYAEGLFIGYRWYDAREIEPQFPFGHGLGYTTFRLGDVTVSGSVADGVTVSVPVTNVGDRPGSTVVQCYVEATPGGPRSPTRVLRAFAKVAATPSGTTHAVMHLTPRAFSVWDVATHTWLVPEGEHRVIVGLSSRDLRGHALVPATS
jgi:beta-glucosidase